MSVEMTYVHTDIVRKRPTTVNVLEGNVHGIMEPLTRSKRVRPSDIVIHDYLFYFILL